MMYRLMAEEKEKYDKKREMIKARDEEFLCKVCFCDFKEDPDVFLLSNCKAFPTHSVHRSCAKEMME